jgi:hypothetical protein
MLSSKRVAAMAVTAAIGVGSISVPAMAATSTHWSSSQCLSWEKSFLKRNPHASKSRKAEGNKVLKVHACTVHIK